MAEYYGLDWRNVLRAGKATALSEKVAAGKEVRRLFPDVRATTSGSREATVPKASSLLRRATLLLTDPDSYEAHYKRVTYTCSHPGGCSSHQGEGQSHADSLRDHRRGRRLYPSRP